MTLDQRPPGPVEPPPVPPDDEPPFAPPPDHELARAPRPDPVPHDDAAERYVLGAVLKDPRQLDTCARLLTPSDFWNPHHETIWRTLLHLAAADSPTQPEAVVAHLLDTNVEHFRRIGGGLFVFNLLEACPVPENADWYATRVEELARHRAAIRVYEQGLQDLRRPGADIDQVLRSSTDHLLEARDALTNLPAATTWSPVDLTAVLSGEFLDPPPEILKRSDGVFMLYDGSVHTISGESESGKTWLTLLAALQLLEQGDNVTFVDFEDRADRVVGRLLALGATPDQIRTHFSYVRPDRPLDDDGRQQIAPAITGRRLVILDGVTEAMTMHGFDLNSNADSALFQGLLPRWIADHGPAVVMIDHVVKDKEKQDRFALGAQHKLAGIDGVAYLVKMIQPFARGKRGLARVDVAKDRPGHVREHARGKTIAEFTLDASADGNVLTAHLMPPGTNSGEAGATETWEPTILMERISRFVQLNEGLSTKAVLDTQNGKTDTKRLALELLVTRGFIGTKAGTRGAVQHFHMKAYYADPERDPEAEDTAFTGPESDPWQEKA